MSRTLDSVNWGVLYLSVVSCLGGTVGYILSGLLLGVPFRPPAPSWWVLVELLGVGVAIALPVVLSVLYVGDRAYGQLGEGAVEP